MTSQISHLLSISFSLCFLSLHLSLCLSISLSEGPSLSYLPPLPPHCLAPPLQFLLVTFLGCFQSLPGDYIWKGLLKSGILQPAY